MANQITHRFVGRSCATGILKAASALAMLSALWLAAPMAFGQSLTAYYFVYIPNVPLPYYRGVVTDNPPQMRTIGGALEPPPTAYFSNEKPFDSTRYLRIYMIDAESLLLGPDARSPCLADRTERLKIDLGTVTVGFDANVTYRYADNIQLGNGCGDSFGGSNPTRWTMQDRFHFGTPVRRRAIDGGAFDASPMTVTREGVPWMTYYWGYRLGMVDGQSDWDEKNRGASPQFASWPAFPTPRENFALTTLPPPYVEGEVTEYRNSKDFPKQPGGQYFYAARQSDRDALDAVPNWQRTGRKFNAGGYVNVCRFYGGGTPGGPNTHFFTADDKECAALKALPFLAYEGNPFVADLPTPAVSAIESPTCRGGTRPLYRAYNNAYSLTRKNDWESNHRFVTDKADIDAMVAAGWVDEGVAMCVPMVTVP